MPQLITADCPFENATIRNISIMENKQRQVALNNSHFACDSAAGVVGTTRGAHAAIGRRSTVMLPTRALPRSRSACGNESRQSLAGPLKQATHAVQYTLQLQGPIFWPSLCKLFQAFRHTQAPMNIKPTVKNAVETSENHAIAHGADCPARANENCLASSNTPPLHDFSHDLSFSVEIQRGREVRVAQPSLFHCQDVL